MNHQQVLKDTVQEFSQNSLINIIWINGRVVWEIILKEVMSLMKETIIEDKMLIVV